MANVFTSRNGGQKYIKYSDRPEWKDITPVPQEDGSKPIVSIAYTEKFKDVFDYFRAVVMKDERSQRALDLCNDAVDLNPANYTVWDFRRKCLEAVKADLEQERDYIGDVIEENPKNYQVWQHRRWVVEKLQDPAGELRFIENMLEEDSKNYHAWQLRQWVLKEFQLWDNELDYTTYLIERDELNNSAWNQRFFVIEQTVGFTPEILHQETNFAKHFLNREPRNESPWNYLRGLLQQEDFLYLCPGVLEWCEQLYEDGCRSPHLLAMIVDCYEEMLQNKEKNRDKHEIFRQVCKICLSLAEKHDEIRAVMWQHKLNEIICLYEQYDTSDRQKKC